MRSKLSRVDPPACLSKDGRSPAEPDASTFGQRSCVQGPMPRAQRGHRLVLLGFLGSLASALAACVGDSSNVFTPPPAQTSSVTVLLTSRENDQLSLLNLGLTGLTLTNQAGRIVNVLAAPLNAEVMHLNGSVEPVLTVDIPQDTYVSANVTTTSLEFYCANNTAGQLDLGEWVNQQAVASSVDLPSPIAVSGTHTSLLLELLGSQSVATSTCGLNGNPTGAYSITPAFNLSVATLASQPTNSANGKANNLVGTIASVNASAGSFQLTSLDGLTWTLGMTIGATLPNTASPSTLVAGMPVDVDAAIQADGSLIATRVAILDANTANLTSWLAPVVFVAASANQMSVGAYEASGVLLSGAGPGWTLGFSGAVYQISSQFANLPTLPFVASFSAANMVAGQRVIMTSHVTTFPNSPGVVPTTTVTLLPQTINGVVTAVSSAGGFDTYSVALSAYSLFPLLSVQPGQTTLLSDPGTVVVYADSNTQKLNSQAIAVGSLLRFNGLVFNDNGTLRMNCAEVLDGVTP